MLYRIHVAWDGFVIDTDHPGKKIENGLAVSRGELGKYFFPEPVVFQKDIFVAGDNSV